jgi:cyclophilin family peptidyl-prolyl cis-trans isomerase
VRNLILFIAGILSLSASAAASEPLDKLSRERLIFHTNRGDIAVALYPNAAPKHVEQILRLAQGGALDNVAITRVDPGFVAQVQSHNSRAVPLSDEQLKLVKTIPGEFTTLKHHRGLLSMARFDDPNSADTSFCFMLGDAPHMDGKYTIFGTVVAGMEVLREIESTPTQGSTPESEILVRKTTFVADGNLRPFTLAPAMAPVYPDAPYQAFFKIFAGLAFLVTILLPIARTAYAELRARKA